MTTQKIAVTVPDAVLRRARAAVRDGRARSLSAYVSRALERQAMDDDLDVLLAEMLAETGGPPTERERRAIGNALDAAGIPAAKKRRGRAR